MGVGGPPGGYSNNSQDAPNTAGHVVQIVGSNNTVSIQWALPLSLIPVSAKLGLYQPSSRSPFREVELLRAEAATSAPLGREAEMASLQEWLMRPDPLLLRTIVARAGAGKTRLAYHLLETLQTDTPAWQSGLLATNGLRRFVRQGAAWRWTQPTLMVVDYASGSAREIAWLLEELHTQLSSGRPPEHPLRILLLDRSAHLLETFLSQTTFGPAVYERYADPPEPVLLPPLRQGDLTQVFEAMLATVVQQRGRHGLPVRSRSVLPSDLQAAIQEHRWQEPLVLMMAALITASDGWAKARSLSRPELARTVADLELGRVDRFVNAHAPAERSAGAITSSAKPLKHLLAHCTLAGGLTREEAESVAVEVLCGTASGSKVEAERLAGDLETLIGLEAPDNPLPAAAAGLASILPPTRPDIVGEALVLNVFAAEGEAGGDAVVWSARRFRYRVLRSLFRLTQDFALVAAPHQDMGSDSAATSAQTVSAPLGWIERILALAETSASEELMFLLEIVDSFPERTLHFREKALRLTQRALELLGGEGPNVVGVVVLPLRALLLAILANRLSELGRREEALAAGEEAVGLYRELTEQHPDAFRPDLAMSLNNLANVLGDVGRREEALAAGKAAVELYRVLAVQHPDAFRPYLGTSLNNLANQLSELGRREEALAAGAEALVIRRELAAQRPDAFRPDLAGSLNGIANLLSAARKRAEAVVAGDEAVGLYRELAEERPDAFRPYLAGSLSNLARLLNAVGRHAEALTLGEEAVRLHRELAEQWPDAFRPDLAGSLRNLTNLLSEVERHEEALVAGEEAVAIGRELAKQRPDAFLPALARALGSTSAVRQSMGQWESAAEGFAEALRVLWPQFCALPAGFQGLAALLLRDYLEAQSKLERDPDADLVVPYLQVLEDLEKAEPHHDNDAD